MSVTAPNREVQPLYATDFTLNRAVIQSSFSGSPALAQAGLYRAGSQIQLDNCSRHSNYISWTFVEWKFDGSGTYNCRAYDEVTIGTVHGFAVGVTTQGWEMNVDCGTHVEIRRLNVNTAIPQMGGEMASTNSTYKSTSNVGYGGDGLPWTVYRAPNLGNPITAGPNTGIVYDLPYTGWHIPRPPTPLTISHPGS